MCLEKRKIICFIKRIRFQVKPGRINMGNTKPYSVMCAVFADNCKHYCLSAVIHIDLIAGRIVFIIIIFFKAGIFCCFYRIAHCLSFDLCIIKKILILFAEFICFDNFVCTYLTAAVFPVHKKLLFELRCLTLFFI